MNTTNKSIYDTTPYLKRRFKGIRYGYRPKRLACEDADWDDGGLREGQQPGESIIAEITTYSMPSSTTTVYGRKSKQGITYRIVAEGGFEYSKMNTPGPLSLGELVDFIDGTWVVADEICGIAIGFNVYNYKILREDMDEPSSELIKDVEELRGFTIVHSEYYDQLSSHYDYIFDEWANDVLAEWDGDENEVDGEEDNQTAHSSCIPWLFELINSRDSELAMQLKAKHGNDVNNLHFYWMLNCEEATKVDYLLRFK